MSASAPVTANEFLDLVRKSGLIDAARFPDPESLPTQPAACASALLKAGLLTRYQAEQLLAGRFRGFRLGAYRILQPLGKGGMGAVFLGEHIDLKRKVAIKVLAADKATDRLAVERFHREGRSAAALDHPNIVRLHDVSQGGGVHYLALEYVEGIDLEALCARRGRIPYGEAVAYVSQAAAGLQHAHERRFVHRDIKPGNLMLGKDGVLKILDMGLARSEHSAADNLTAKLGGAGEAIGTAEFVSPEQALGHPVDARGDIYSLGATLYALLAGHPPFSGNLTQLLVKHQLAELPPLDEELGIPDVEELNTVLDTMMAKDPDDRYQSAEEVIEALAPWLGAPAVGTRSTANLRASAAPTRASTGRLKSRSLRSQPQEAEPSAAVQGKKYLAMGLAAGGLLVLIAVVAAAIIFTRDSKPAATIPRNNPDPVQAISVRNEASPTAAGPEVSQRLATGQGPIQDIAYSADGKRFCVVEHGGPLTLWEVDSPPKLVHTIPARAGGQYKCCTLSPDGKRVIVGGNNMPILTYNAETGDLIRDDLGHADETWSVVVSGDGQVLASGGNDGTVTLRKLATGEVIRTLDMEAKRVWCVALSADASLVAAGCGPGLDMPSSNAVRVWETATGKEVCFCKGHTKDVRWVAFRGDGKVLASAAFDGTVRQWNVADGVPVNVIDAHRNGYAERVFYTAGGARLVTCGGPFGSNTLADAGALKVWDASTGKPLHTFGNAEGRDLISLAVSPDGSTALTGGRDKPFRLWKLPK